MISNTLYYGSIAIIIVSVAVPVGCVFFSFKKGGTKGMPLFLLIGLAASMLMSSLGGIISGVVLPAKLIDTSVILYMLLSAVLFAVMDTGAKFLSVHLSRKAGLGFFKGFTLGAGYVAGKFLMNTSLYLSLSTAIKTFQDNSLEEVIDMQIKQSPDSDPVQLAKDLTEMREGLVNANPLSYFIEALGICSIIFLDIVLIILLIKFFKEKKILIGLGITAGIRFVFSLIESLIKNLPLDSMNNAISEDTSLILSTILYAAMLAASIYFIRKLYYSLPKEEKSGEAINPLRQQKIDAEKQAEKRAWSEFRNINVRNIKSPEERTAADKKADETPVGTSEDDIDEASADKTEKEIKKEKKSTSRDYLDEDEDEA